MIATAGQEDVTNRQRSSRRLPRPCRGTCEQRAKGHRLAAQMHLRPVGDAAPREAIPTKNSGAGLWLGATQFVVTPYHRQGVECSTVDARCQLLVPLDPVDGRSCATQNSSKEKGWELVSATTVVAPPGSHECFPSNDGGAGFAAFGFPCGAKSQLSG